MWAHQKSLFGSSMTPYSFWYGKYYSLWASERASIDQKGISNSHNSAKSQEQSRQYLQERFWPLRRCQLQILQGGTNCSVAHKKKNQEKKPHPPDDWVGCLLPFFESSFLPLPSPAPILVAQAWGVAHSNFSSPSPLSYPIILGWASCKIKEKKNLECKDCNLGILFIRAILTLLAVLSHLKSIWVFCVRWAYSVPWNSSSSTPERKRKERGKYEIH